MPETPSNPIADQMGEQWRGLIAMMTAQGATRDDIIKLTAATAAAVLVMTATELWPAEQVVPASEEAAHDNYRTARLALEATA